MTAGPALVSDLDGTLTLLPVAWEDLRTALGVASISALWDAADQTAWATVALHEELAARNAQLDARALAWIASLGSTTRMAILTDNSQRAAAAVVERSALLQEICVAIIGREQLKGPKRDPEVFDRGLSACLRGLGNPPPASVTYLGDADYELSLAMSHGLRAVAVSDLGVPRHA